MSATPDYRMTCKRCGGAYLEMVDLLFHACQQPDRPKPRPKKARRNRAGVTRA
jgi:hypothetical protein